MPGIDELLRTEGERWRAEVDGRCPTTAEAPATPGRRRVLGTAGWPPPRRILSWSASLAGAAAVVALSVALISHGAGDSTGSASSDRAAAGGAVASPPRAAAESSVATRAAPCDPATMNIAPRQVRAGGLITVTGEHYGFASCQLSTAQSTSTVTVRLTTADGRTVTLLRARPSGVDGAFRVRVTVPAGAAIGPATLTDGRGHHVRLLIQEAS